MPPVNNYSFISSFPIQMPFISLSYLIAVVGLPIHFWIKVVKVDVFVLFLIPRKTTRAFPIEYDMDVGLSYMAFIMLRYIPSNFTLLRFLNFFIINGCWILSNVFFCICRYDHVIFIFHFVYVECHVNWFEDIEPTFYPRNKSESIMMYDLFKVLLNSVW